MLKVPSILVGSAGGTIWMKVEGRGSFQNCGCVKEFFQRMISRGHRDYVMDLDQCELMDSTFMGTLAAVAFSLREKGCEMLRVVRANTRNRELLESLGLDNLFRLESDPYKPAPHSLHTAASHGQPPVGQKVDILSAHEALVEADPRNAVRFQDVIEYLRHEIAELEGNASPLPSRPPSGML
ncbi:MAG: STAS domain-containing protein [Terrimicrobiaceae bacterium]|jgi:anti-anti-sigma regulatory factor